jgi:hypothetical protein
MLCARMRELDDINFISLHGDYSGELG